MTKAMNPRLVNDKTRAETGFDFVVGKLRTGTPFGLLTQKGAKPFLPGQENDLRRELDKQEKLLGFMDAQEESLRKINEIFGHMNDVSGSIERSARDVLNDVELFEIKSMLLNSEKLRDRVEGLSEDELTEEFVPSSQVDLLDLLDPRGDRLHTFHIYDDYSPELKEARESKKQVEGELRVLRKALADKTGPESAEADKTRAEELTKKLDELELLIEGIETEIRMDLSNKIGAKKDELLENLKRIGRLDYVLAKCALAREYNLVKPEIVSEHRVTFSEGRHIQVEEILKKKGGAYCPINMDLSQGTSCITGANMGGKTVSLKLTGLIPIMAQYGFYVPCEKAELGFSNYIRILVGDSQSVERGLSSFGSEIEELKDIFDKAEERSLILVDEIASGTNPAEGMALTKSIATYLSERPYISLITTHFDAVTGGRIKNLQVRGLRDVDFRNLRSELSLANRKERIAIIGKYMDYRLETVDEGVTVPRDAINISSMIGLPSEIIEEAKKILEEEN